MTHLTFYIFTKFNIKRYKEIQDFKDYGPRLIRGADEIFLQGDHPP